MRRGTGIGLARVAVALFAVALVATACGSEPAGTTSTEVVSPFAACPAPAATGSSGAGSSAAGSSGVGDVADRALPAVSLPCFTGGEPVVLARLGQPAVINFWASSCAPCRKELPQLQRFADATAGRLSVIGVVTADTRTAAASAGEDFGVRFPAVFDPDSKLLTAWGRNALPVTLFVDAHGRVRHEDVSGAITLDRVSALAAQYLGVTA